MFERNVDKSSRDGWRRDERQPPPFIIAPLVGYKWDDGWWELGIRATCGAWAVAPSQKPLSPAWLLYQKPITLT